MPDIARPEDLVEYLDGYIGSSSLDFQTIAKYDDNLIAGYPAVQITPGILTKAYHGTHTFRVTINSIIYVMHSDMTVGRARRSLADLQLATKLVAWLEAGTTEPYSQANTLQGNAINAWVESETPAAMPPRTSKAKPVVSTRMVFCIENVIRFK